MNYRIFFTILTLLCLAAPTWAATPKNQLLVCLGDEEFKIHKRKIGGPIYKLNQHFVNELASINDVPLKKEYYQEICGRRAFSPSVNLLYHLLLKGKSIFVIPTANMNPGLREFKIALLNNLQKTIPHILFQYLSNLQALAPTPKCLFQHIPYFSYFLGRYKYLETDYPPEALIDDRKKVEKLFKGLKGLDQILNICHKDFKEQQKKLFPGK